MAFLSDCRVCRFARPISVLVLIGLAAPAATQQQQQVLPPIARYTVDAGTTSGMGAMGGGMAGAMAMMSGRGGGAMHELYLKLGSTRAPTGAPSGDHFMPAGAQLGKSVPLVTPVQVRGESMPTDMQTPKGRLLLYWGCGANAPKDQPIVIDFAKVAKGQVPPGLYAAPLNIPGDWEITQGNSKTYGDWPNGKDGKAVQGGSSLLGAHKVTSTYAPEVNFTLAQDFMAALNARSAEQAGGSVMLSWNSVPRATGYYAWVMSAKDTGRGQPTEMVWWTSSATQAFGGPLQSWLSPAAVQKLIGTKTVMPPSQTSCQVPAEVKKAGGEMMMGNLYAYGPEQHFAFPARPTDPKIAWKPDWTTRVRFRSSSMFIVGMDMESMGGMSASDDSDQPSQSGSGQAPQGSKKPKCKGLGGIAQRAAGLCE